jgi:hypothetical protein
MRRKKGDSHICNYVIHILEGECCFSSHPFRGRSFFKTSYVFCFFRGLHGAVSFPVHGKAASTGMRQEPKLSGIAKRLRLVKMPGGVWVSLLLIKHIDFVRRR